MGIFVLGFLGNSNAQFFQRKKRDHKEKVEISIETSHTIKVDFKDSTNEIEFPIRVFIQKYIPYCGGAAPDWKQMNNYAPVANTQFSLIDLGTGKRTTVLTDSNGIIELNLPVGNYGIKEMFKDCSLYEFKQKFKVENSEYIIAKDSECYEKWWQSNLGEFEVIAGAEKLIFTLTENNSCFTGNNPCIMYVGLYPP